MVINMDGFFENRMELTRGERQIDKVGDGRSKDRRNTYFQKPGGDRIRVRLHVRTVEEKRVSVGMKYSRPAEMEFYIFDGIVC